MASFEAVTVYDTIPEMAREDGADGRTNTHKCEIFSKRFLLTARCAKASKAVCAYGPANEQMNVLPPFVHTFAHHMQEYTSQECVGAEIEILPVNSHGTRSGSA